MLHRQVFVMIRKVSARNISLTRVPAMMLATISGRIVNISILINTSPGSPAIQNFVIEYVIYIITWFKCAEATFACLYVCISEPL